MTVRICSVPMVSRSSRSSAADRADGHIVDAVGCLLPVVEWPARAARETRAQAMEELAACLVDIDGTEKPRRGW